MLQSGVHLLHPGADLLHAVDHLHLQPQGLGERGGGLLGAGQRGGEHRLDRLTGQPLGQGRRLGVSLIRQRSPREGRVEKVVDIALGLAVSDQDQSHAPMVDLPR